MSGEQSPRPGAWVERLALAVLAAGLCAWTWRSWADPLVDYGRELYGAWRLCAGDRLGLDLDWLQGPLSVELNGALFRIAGASYRTLFLSDLAVLALVLLLLRALLRRSHGRVAAGAASALVLGVFAFGQYGVVGNYAFAAPYSHELTHGFLLALTALWALERAAGSARPLGWTALAGLALGATALTKAEVALALAPAAGLRLLLGVAGHTSRAERARAALVLLAGALLPPLLTYLAFLPGRASMLAWRTTLGAFVHLGHSELRALPFYEAGMGLDDPAANFDRLLRGSLAYGLLFVVPALLASRTRARALQRPLAGAIALLASLALFFLLRERIPYRELGRPFPLLIALLLVDALVERLRARDQRARTREATRATLALFALLLLAKIVLQARILHYGFVLGLPAALLLLALLVDSLPRWAAARGGSAALARGYGLGLAAAVVCVHLAWTAEWVREDRHELGSGADRMRVATRGSLAAEALAEILRRTGPEDRLLVLPEGVTLNYLARRKSPAPCVNFMPPELLIYGEEALLAALERDPPALVAIVHKDTSEYGFPRFGQDYGRALWSWVQSRYRRVALYGEVPLVSERFGIALLERVR